ncbi:hypothetical protein RNN91_04360 [Mycoplasmopsis felis]|nr:hypothetical protein [Mycoplasmopsis felis]WQQ01451.1 hypothetical protein RRG54_02570 [Mycoplasmopsis felis]
MIKGVLWCFKILTISKNNVPLILSSKPSLSPAFEKGWQGKPAHKTSPFGISSAFIFGMSL